MDAAALRRLPCGERPHWRAQAEALGFGFHTIGGERYWDERACYAFTLEQIERDLEAPTGELHQMALDLVDELVQSEALLRRLGLPEPLWDWIAESWRARWPSLYGRMDLCYDGRSPARLLELNYDTPTALYEAGYYQWRWLEEALADGRIPAGCDQYNRIQESLIETLASWRPQLSRLHLAALRDAPEDAGTIAYLADCATQAGLRTRMLAIEDLGLSARGELTDLDDQAIDCLFKLYPWEWMLADPYARALPGSGARLVEPPWKALLSHKGILVLLWERHPGHPNLLPARWSERWEAPPGWVCKPAWSREGANVLLVSEGGERLHSEGPYAQGPFVQQRCARLPCIDGEYPVVGSWVVGDQAVGVGLRADSGPITRDSSRFVPHVILP